MKKSIALILVAFIAMPFFTQAQTVSKQDRIIGKWLTADKKGNIEIYKKGDKYYGKIVGGNDEGAEEFDVHNPDPAKRKQRLTGMNILKNFTFDDGEWKNGTVYDPDNGKTYSCVMELTNNNALEITGYIGIKLFGRTEVWTRLVK